MFALTIRPARTLSRRELQVIGAKHKDVLHHLRQDPLTTRANDVVAAEAAWIHPEETVEAAADRMVAEDISHMLVGHGQGTLPEGVLSSWDLVSFYAGRNR